MFVWHLSRPFYTHSLPHSETVEAKGEQSLCHENEIQKLSQWFQCYSVFPEKRGRIYDIKASAWLASSDPHISAGWIWCPLAAAVLLSGYTCQLDQFTPPSEDLQTHDLFLFGGRIERERNIFIFRTILQIHKKYQNSYLSYKLQDNMLRKIGEVTYEYYLKYLMLNLILTKVILKIFKTYCTRLSNQYTFFITWFFCKDFFMTPRNNK